MSVKTPQLVSAMRALLDAMKNPGGLTRHKQAVIDHAQRLLRDAETPEQLELMPGMMGEPLPVYVAGQPFTCTRLDLPEQKRCVCDNCGKRSFPSDLKEIEDCCLTAGDEVPAGRCPACDTLTYVRNSPKHYRVLLHDAIAALGEGT